MLDPAGGGAEENIGAENLSQTRREHASEAAEDYVEAIADLVAEMDAEGIEHHVSPKTLAAMERALRLQ